MYPFINIFEKQLPTYGLCVLIALVTVTFLTCRTAKKKEISFDAVIIFMSTGLGFALLGAYLLYIGATYSPKEIAEFVNRLDFSFLIPSGFVFFGGLIGGIPGAIIGAKLAKISISDICEIFLPFLPLGHAIGRVGCLFAGCCYGIEYHGPLAVYYPNAITDALPCVGYFPVQILEALLNIVIFFILMWYSKKTYRKLDVFFLYLVLYSCSRFCLEYLRGDKARGGFLFLSTSQWISVIILVACVIYFALPKNRVAFPDEN